MRVPSAGQNEVQLVCQAVFDWRYAPNSSMLSSASFLPLMVFSVLGFVKK